jgi:hypothetical protein
MHLVHKLALLSLSAFLSLIPRISLGMNIDVEYINPFTGHSGPYPTLVLRGEIMPGDYDRLFEYAESNNVDLHTTQITLASPGGDISEAMKIGQLFRSIYAEVSVGPVTGQCASACFILYASAVHRTAAPGLVGIHRPYLSKERLQTLSPSQAEALETTALSSAEGYLHNLRVPSSIVDIMFENASTEIHWLNLDELRMVGDRPAWYEEFLIARCGLDKDAEAQFLQGSQNRALFSKLMDVASCGTQLTRREAINSLAQATASYYKTRPAGEAERDSKRNGSHAASYADLDREVPNWRQINSDKDFLAWMDDGDQMASNGVSTNGILRQAFETNQRAVVVAIFKEYVQRRGATIPVSASPSGPSPALASADRWVRFAEVADTSGGVATHGTWDLDRDSLKRGPGSQFSFDVRLTTTNEGAGTLPQLRNLLSLTHWSVDCAARTYADYGGTVGYQDTGKWVPGPYQGSGRPIAASSNPRAAQLVNGACAALTSQ